MTKKELEEKLRQKEKEIEELRETISILQRGAILQKAFTEQLIDNFIKEI